MTANRLAQRKERIRTEMFPNVLSLQSKESNSDDLVWVESAQLLQYVSCGDRMNEYLDGCNGRTLLQHHKLLCSHEPPGLHPRVARRGKVLPKAVYEAYVAGLRQEQRAVVGQLVDESEVCDCLILPTENLLCLECSSDYQKELGQKLKTVKAMKKLYDMLDPKELDRFKFEFGNSDTYGHERDNYAYILSRRFVTAFRNQITTLMKNAAAAAADAKACEREISLGHFSAENVNEGLDGLDLSSFEKKVFGMGPNSDNELAVPNSNITCKHF